VRAIVWNDDLDGALLSLRAAGRSFFECQDRIGICAESCRKRALALGARTSRPLKQWPPGVEEILCKMRRDGASWTAISRRVGFPAASCAERGRHLGLLTANPNSWTPDMDDLLRSLRERGNSWHRIGVLMDVSEWGARNRGRILGLVQHKTASAVKAAPEATRAVADDSSLNLGGAAPNEPGAASFGRAA
jgi:hypothetical protein